jgi:tetratricopeptide (TPR) repeat protein
MPVNQRYAGVGESATEVVLKPLAQVSSPIRLSEYAIDYICRLYQRNKPSNKIFFVEVKTATSHALSWRRKISRDTIGFWLSQSYPVYIVVYDLENDVCYWISAEDNREKWSKKLEKGVKSISIRVDGLHILKKAPDPNLDFVHKIEQDTIRLSSIYGIPRVLYKGGKGIKGVYYFEYPDLGVLSNLTRGKFQNTIRRSLYLLINDGLLRKDLKDLQEAYRLSKVLTEFDKAHYENFLVRAEVCLQLKKTEEAQRYYNEAISCLERDPIWDINRPEGIKSKAEIISEIQSRIARIPND